MAFHGPETTDYDNVTSLNEAFLTLLGRDQVLQQCLTDFPPDLASRLKRLSGDQVKRLASVPFLLMSFRERDDRYWRALLGEACEGDLFRVALSADVDTLISAGLGFIWQLAQQNPYALRLMCGAPLSWCEHIAEITFYRLLDAVRRSGSAPALRAAGQHEQWRKLLTGGLSRKHSVRHATQVSALQAILTTPRPELHAHWSLAARQVNAPLRRVAERPDSGR